MSQLTDFIASYGVANAATFCRNNPDFAVFNLLWRDPEQLILVCNAMGWQTLDDLTAWVTATNKAIGNTASFVSLIDPVVTIEYDSLPKVDFETIHSAITAQCNIRSDCFFDQSDVTYRLPTKAQIAQLAMANPYRTKHWVAEKFDCDDFVRAFLGWLTQNNLGNLAIGFLNQTPIRNGQMIGGHATAIACDQDKNIWIIEPQNGLLYAPKAIDAARLGGYWFADSMQLARVLF